MVNISKCDFSKEAASFKKKLLIDCLQSFTEGLKQPERVSDDELELVAAAGTIGAECPTPDLPCRNCPHYVEGAVNHCSKGCTK